MIMTHYMELLAMNQPWNLILFMVIPVGMAEALVATEFFTLYWGESKNKYWRLWNKYIGMILGVYFLIVFLYLALIVVPSLTWRGWIDQVAVYAYMLGVVPLFSITLMEWGLLGSGRSEHKRLKIHAVLLIAFLVVSHIAMIFGMVNPTLGGWQEPLPAGYRQMDHSQKNHDRNRP